MPTKIIKENNNTIIYYIYHNFNNFLSSFAFPIALKYSDASPIFKNDNKTDKQISELQGICKTLRK